MTELARGSLQVDRLRRTTIPRDILTAAGIPPGSALVAHVDERGRIVLESPQLLLEQLQDAIAAGIAARASADGRDPAQEPAAWMAEELLSERAAEALAEADDDASDNPVGDSPGEPDGASARTEEGSDPVRLRDLDGHGGMAGDGPA